MGYWSVDSGINIRLFFDELARKYKIDPRNPQHWYHINHKLILSAKV